MIWSTDPSKNIFKNPPKIHDKAVQSIILWLNLNKINEISIPQSAHKQGNPSFRFHAPGSKHRYPCSQTTSAVPKYFPCLLQFYTDYRIWHASRAWKRKTFIFTQLKNIQIQSTLFAIFRRITDLRPIYCSLTTGIILLQQLPLTRPNTSSLPCHPPPPLRHWPHATERLVYLLPVRTVRVHSVPQYWSD